MSLVWEPQPGPQTEALCAEWCNELFYGGAAGGGKSDFLLGDFLQDVPTYGQAWRGILFRRTYPELEELIARSLELYSPTGAEWVESKKTWTWPNGASLKMRYLEQEKHKFRYQGHQYTWIGWDELTQWPTLNSYRYLRHRLRSAHPVPTKRIRSAGNPGGPGHHAVKSYFITPAPGGYLPIYDKVTKLYRMFIPAKLEDNQILLKNDPDYEGRLSDVGSEALVKAIRDGDWDVVEGAYFDCWSHKLHVIAPFTLPREWLRFRSGDWGSASPFSIGWWAVVQDDFRLSDGRILPRGALVRYREWYGCKDPAVGGAGLKLKAEEIGSGIVEREKGDPKLTYGRLDPRCFAIESGPSIAERINNELVKAKLAAFTQADNRRVPQGQAKDGSGPLGGWDQMRGRLVGVNGVPMIYCFDTCIASIRTIPILQHDPDKPEDLDTKSEDHAADDWRYGCMSRPWLKPDKQPPDPKDGYQDESEEFGGDKDSFMTM